MASTTGHEPSLETLREIHRIVERHLAQQFDQVAVVTLRAQQVLAFGGVLLGIVVAIRRPDPTSDTTVGLLAGALVLFVAVVIEGGRAWFVGKYRNDPEPDALFKKYRLKDEAKLLEQVIANAVAAREKNGNAIAAKLRHLKWAAGWLIAEVVYLVLVLIIEPYVA